MEVLKVLLSPAPLAAGIVLFTLLKYCEAVGNLFQLLANQRQFRRVHDS